MSRQAAIRRISGQLKNSAPARASQASQLASLEALFAAIAAQQKQMLDLIGRALADHANMQAALAELRRSLEQSAGQNQNAGRQGMQ